MAKLAKSVAAQFLIISFSASMFFLHDTSSLYADEAKGTTYGHEYIIGRIDNAYKDSRLPYIIMYKYDPALSRTTKLDQKQVDQTLRLIEHVQSAELEEKINQISVTVEPFDGPLDQFTIDLGEKISKIFGLKIIEYRRRK